MAIPDFQTIMLPLLIRLKDKQTYKISELIEILADEFKLTDEEKEMMFESGNSKIFRNRVRWARLYLKKADLINDLTFRRCPFNFHNFFCYRFFWKLPCLFKLH
ncbi:winged helix-turn-helix domain-containing protein [Methanosarcina vacuolata]|uniref:winged helix-turn-helix domain-containing protein n=1 Tax=Methanosarcina vacuolata TaxID=2215 RepID=UPI00064E691C|nr:winged helix-turn-helix domain-containing protein [Methanosarcina vacuolata]